MPELPEVEVVRRGLEGWVTGRKIVAVAVLHPRAIRRHVAGPDDFIGRLAGRRFLAPRRRGKYLWVPLDDGAALLAHLGMSGQLLLASPDRPYETHLRARLVLSIRRASAEPAPPAEPGTPGDDIDLRFVDQRTFGHLMVTEMLDGVPAPIAHIAMDPLEGGFDDEALYHALRRRHTGIKRALLDQSLISGVGNIYADEALWRARLHWARPTETLTRAEVTRLLAGVREVMGAALAVGGTSFDRLYVNVNGESGYFGRALNVYGRRDEPCARCGMPIRRDIFMNRSSYSCPKCQPRPRRARF
ncbi:MAG TPA: bifunctional DNA-formamidopyrimidine glycosylase/DNA-(apurinic or apyrimidinic site) lyase [Streptosporangiaceae bacterium]|nr:bifunctional DNA-formamidopyrimidine glycosylase/DNA-(apurinic or apyrimidinic site) lyase [Streptosporangiaceae bacterium]